MPANRRFGEILVRLGVLRPLDVERVLEAQRRHGGRAKFGQVARTMGLLEEEHILAALAVQMNVIPGLERLSLAQVLALLGAPAG